MERPPAPPEAVLIRLAREAANIRIADAAARAGVSVARWSQIEAGSELRRGKVSTVTGRAGTIARMAHIAGVSPERLAGEGQRPDAAEILQEIISQQDAAAAADVIEVVRRPSPPPADRDLAVLRDDDEPGLQPFLESVRRDLLAAAGVGLSPDREVPDLPDSVLGNIDASVPAGDIFAAQHERDAWQVPLLTARERIRLIARLRRMTAEALSEAGRRNAVLIPRAGGRYRNGHIWRVPLAIPQ